MVDKEPYVPMPEVIATPVVSEIDPRAEVDEQYDLTVGNDRTSIPSGH